MRYYLHLFKLRIITNLQYRADAIAGISTQIFFGLVYISVYLAFYKYGNSSNVSMNWDEMVTYLWLQQSFLLIIFAFLQDKEFLNIIKNGNISYEIIRPQNLFFKQLIKIVAKKYTGAFLRFIPVLILAFIFPAPYRMSLPASVPNFLIFFVSLFVSGILNSTLITIVHVLTIYTIDHRGLFAIYGTIADLFMGGIVPLPFLPKILIKISNYLPFRYIQDFPFRVYTNNIHVGEGINMLIASVIWTVVMIIVGNLITKHALKKAVVNGG